MQCVIEGCLRLADTGAGRNTCEECHYRFDKHRAKPVTRNARPPRLYLIGSLRNAKVPTLAEKFRAVGFDVFDDWFAAGPEADDNWQRYEKARGHDYITALKGNAGQHVFHYDKKHIDASDLAVLVAPAGKSAHLELGYFLGQGKPGYIFMEEEPERFDVMYNFATGIFLDESVMLKTLRNL